MSSLPPPPAEPATVPAAASPAPPPVAEPLPALPPAAPPVLDAPEIIPEPAQASIARKGEYQRSLRLHLRPDVIEWIAPGCAVAILLLSLFAWYYREDYALNLWELAFTARGYSIYTFYTVVFMFLAFPIAVVALCLEKRWIPVPDGLQPYWRWRSLVVGGLIGLPFIFFLGDYIDFQFLPFGTQATIAMKLAFRLHAAAVVACGLQFWLEQRDAANLPLPRLTIRW